MGVPVHGIFSPEASLRNGAAHAQTPPLTLTEQITQASRMCDRQQVSWEFTALAQHSTTSICARWQQKDLLILNHRFAYLRELIEARSRQDQGLLVCPEPFEGVSRILLLDQGDHPGKDWAEVARQLQGWFQADFVLLTLASSERAGKSRQEEIWKAFAPTSLHVEFDLLVAPISEVVKKIACWRRCSLVVLEKSSHSWWGRWRRDPAEELVTNEAGPALLALPEGRLLLQNHGT